MLTPVRDRRAAGPVDEPSMSVAAFEPRRIAGLSLLLEHVLALGFSRGTVPARDRLDEALGADLSGRLVSALTRQREPSA